MFYGYGLCITLIKPIRAYGVRLLGCISKSMAQEQIVMVMKTCKCKADTHKIKIHSKERPICNKSQWHHILYNYTNIRQEFLPNIIKILLCCGKLLTIYLFENLGGCRKSFRTFRVCSGTMSEYKYVKMLLTKSLKGQEKRK